MYKILPAIAAKAIYVPFEQQAVENYVKTKIGKLIYRSSRREHQNKQSSELAVFT